MTLIFNHETADSADSTDIAHSVATRTVEYESAGEQMYGHLAVPSGADVRPVVLIAHEGAGLNDFQRRRADLLAEQGYIALAMDYHSGRWYSDPAAMMERLGPLLGSPERCRAVGQTALDVLLSHPRADSGRVAAIGYGAGGTIALELGRGGVNLRAIAAVNPILAAIRPEDSRQIRCPVLACVGSKDPLSPPEARQAFIDEMDNARVDWQLLIYGGAEHAFHLPPVTSEGALATSADEAVAMPGISHSPVHAQRCWEAILTHLEESMR